MSMRIFVTAAVAGLVCAPALAATSAANAGPWAKVPALPTACLSSQDQWWEMNNAAIEAVQQDHYAQNEVNDAIEQKFRKVQEENPMAHGAGHAAGHDERPAERAEVHGTDNAAGSADDDGRHGPGARRSSSSTPKPRRS